MERVTVIHADCREAIRSMPDCSVDSCVTDGPYALVSITKRFGKDGTAPAKAREGGSGVYVRASSGFMGQAWDTGETYFDRDFWREVLRVLKPGAHVAAFCGTRTYHRLGCAIEDAGFEIRDTIAWLFGSGFPKSHDVSKGIDKAAGDSREIIRERYTAKRIKPGATVVREGAYGKQDISFTATDTKAASAESEQWEGWGTALKPALEPICLARKPLSEKTIAANVLKWGTGALNIDGCRIGETGARNNGRSVDSNIYGKLGTFERVEYNKGRWPANVVHDGSEEVVAAFPHSDGQQGNVSGAEPSECHSGVYSGPRGRLAYGARNDTGSAARFFYSSKADADDRLGSKHPTVKPIDLMQWLCRLITPPKGKILDPFAGTGTTGEAAYREGMFATLIEREASYVEDIKRRVSLLQAGPDARLHASLKAAGKIDEHAGPLFAEVA